MRHFYVRTAEPFFEVDQETGKEIERIAHHPVAVVVATEGTAPYDPDDPAFDGFDYIDAPEPGQPVEVIMFAVATCNSNDVFDKRFGRMIAERRLTDPKWHPEKGSARVAASFILPTEGSPRNAILNAIATRKVHWHPDCHEHMFPTRTRFWAEDMLVNPRHNNDDTPDHDGEV